MTTKPLWLALLTVAACAPPRPAVRASSAATDPAPIEAVVARYVQFTNEGNAPALAALYAEDAVLLPPDQEAVEGRAAIERFWRDGMEEGLRASVVRVERQEDLAYVIGRYTLPATPTDPPDEGKLVLCLRQRDGAWQVVTDIWNGSLAPADEAEEPRREGRAGGVVS